MPTFIISLLDYIDETEYKTYMDKVGPIFQREGVKLHVNDADPIFLTSDLSADKIVVIEFEDDAHMARFFALPEYQEAARHRDKGVNMRAIRVKGFLP